MHLTPCLHTVFLAPFWRPLRRRIASYLDSDLGVSKPVLHDASGNVTDNGKVTLVYDATEQPVSMGGAASGSFAYDGHYRRAKQVIDGETVYSFYDLSGAMLFRDNVTTGVNTEYVRLAGETIARLTNQPGSNYSYLHPDHLGSAVAATDPNGALLWREHYTAYGEKMLSPAANDNHDGFTGHVSDEASGLTYMQARYYDPVIARFLSADPVGFVDSGFNPQMFNRYSYVANDPINVVDPDGRVGVAVKFVRKLVKNKGDIVQTTFDVGGDVVTVFAPGSTPFERIEAAVSLASPVDFDDVNTARNALKATGKKFGGRKGGLDTRAQNQAIGQNIEKKGGTTTGGFGDKETQFGSGKGSRFSDGSATDANGNPFQVQTVDTDAAGNLTKREAGAARDIAERGNQPVVCVAKETCN